MQKETESPQSYLALAFAEQKAKELDYFFHVVGRGLTYVCGEDTAIQWGFAWKKEARRMWHLPLTAPQGLCRGNIDPKPPQVYAQPPPHRHKPTEASSRLCPGCAAAIVCPEEKAGDPPTSHPSDTV